MLDMKALERALAPITEIGREEWSFTIEGTTIVLRAILPSEEIAVQRYAKNAVDANRIVEEGVVQAEEEQGFEALEFFYLFRSELLAYAIIQVNAVDLRNEAFVATGEMTESNKPIRIPKHVAMRNLIQKWSRQMVTAAFTQYGYLIQKLDDAAMTLVEYTPSDLEAEIDRVEHRLEELKTERQRRAPGDANFTAAQMESISDAAEKVSVDFDRVVKAAAVAEPPTPKTMETTPRKPVIPERSLPPVAPPAMVQPARVFEDPSLARPFEDIPDSFGDIEDEEVREAEALRIVAARRKMAEDRRNASNPPQRPVPPHLRGMQPVGLVDSGVSLATPEDLARLGIPGHLNNQDLSDEAELHMAAGRRQIDPAMQQPTEIVSGRGRARAQQQTVVINPAPQSNQTRNPRYRPPER